MSSSNPLDLSQPIMGWIRFRHRHSALTIDINPRDRVHLPLLTFYRNNPFWEELM